MTLHYNVLKEWYCAQRSAHSYDTLRRCAKCPDRSITLRRRAIWHHDAAPQYDVGPALVTQGHSAIWAAHLHPAAGAIAFCYTRWRWCCRTARIFNALGLPPSAYNDIYHSMLPLVTAHPMVVSRFLKQTCPPRAIAKLFALLSAACVVTNKHARFDLDRSPCRLQHQAACEFVVSCGCSSFTLALALIHPL